PWAPLHGRLCAPRCGGFDNIQARGSRAGARANVPASVRAEMHICVTLGIFFSKRTTGMAGPTIENNEFRRILTRNVALPLGMSVLSAVVFVGIIAYLINSLTWVEHSQRVIGGAHEVRKLSAEMESGMRGYLLA